MYLAIYCEQGKNPEEIMCELEASFPGSKTKIKKAGISLEVPPLGPPAVIRKKIIEIQGVVRADWLA